MDTQKQQIVDRVKQANNILVTVKSNPTVDHLAACIGLTLALNKLGKHATAVFSGDIPSTIEFLQPDKTLEKNTDSLRDFIIALDKSKADKLRYKVEDKIVKIFITPYRTSISERDLNFSQGDFNVDVVLALGVHQQADLDQAITAHGRILHDATVASINVAEGPNLGGLNWTKTNASSLSELAVELIDGVDKQLLDGQIATAVLTGIVAETDRFSNNRTSPQTMSISAELMAAGANQQLIATKLAEPAALTAAPLATAAAGAPISEAEAQQRAQDGTLEIDHEPAKAEPPQIEISNEGALQNLGQTSAEKPSGSESEAQTLPPTPEKYPKILPDHKEGPPVMTEPPLLGGDLTGSTSSEFFDPLVDRASGAPTQPPILNREPLSAANKTPAAAPTSETETTETKGLPELSEPSIAQISPPTPEPSLPPLAPPTENSASPAGQVAPPLSTFAPATIPPASVLPPVQAPVLPPPTPSNDGAMPGETLSDIEKQLNSPHIAQDQPTAGTPFAQSAPTTTSDQPTTQTDDDELTVSSARDAVAQAIGGAQPGNQPLAPVEALNAQPVDLNLRGGDALPPGDASTPMASMPTQTVNPTTPPATIPNPAPFAPDGLSLPGVTGATSSPVTPVAPPTATPTTASQSLPDVDKLAQELHTVDDPNAPPPVPPPMLPPTPVQ